MYTIEVMLLLGLMIGGLVLMIQWLKKMPTAYAWDPNSHDKMATYSLDLLKKSEKKTLFGWLLWQTRFAIDSPEQFIQNQIRRGSIEEDMNSAFIHEWVADGTNGAYHFYNPNNGEGLSDSDLVTHSVAVVSYSDKIMPSALERATSLDEGLDVGITISSGKSWHFDNEERNYTIVDAMRYYLRGYQHLGFYAIGRTIHLLQDMAVPAHVRNDSHSGKAGDTPDPLEQFAADIDGEKKDWTFVADRVYSSEGKHIFKAAQSIWQQERQQHYHQTSGLFKSLARWTYDGFYSVNTIPGNYDSHHPEHARVKPFSSPLNLDKCHPAVFQMGRLLNTFGHNIEASLSQLLPQCFSNGRSGVINGHVKHLQECTTGSNRCIINADCKDFSIPDKRQTCENCVLDVQGISKSIKGIINEVQSMLASYEGYISGRIPTGALDYRMVESFKQQGEVVPRVCRNVIDEYEKFKLESFVNGAAGSGDSRAVVKKWIESFYTTEELGELLKKLETTLGFVKPNAPYCLNYKIIYDQWLATEAKAVAYGAYLLANWFEWQYDPARNIGNHLGVGLWLNENAKEGEDPILRSLETVESNESISIKAKDVVTLGVANHFPCHMNMAVEIEIMEEDDFISENGVEINLSWGHLSPDWSRLDDGEYIIATGSEPPKKKVWTADVIKKETDGYAGETITQVVLLGSGGEKKVRIILEETEPYNLSLMKNFPLPQERGGKGGISRVEENNGIFKYTLNPTPGEPGGRDEINTSLLRMEFSMPAAEEQGN